MSHTIKVGLIFFVLFMAAYITLVSVIGSGIERLSQAREGELKAATLQQNMLRRMSLRQVKQVLRINAPALPDPTYTLPMPAIAEPTTADAWPAQSQKETALDFLSTVTPHFRIETYNQELLFFIAGRIEKYYDAVVRDIGLYEAGIVPKTIRVIILRDKDDYLKRTGRPAWSAGYISYDEMTIYTFEGPHLRYTVPHELAHLMFGLFMADPAKLARCGWVNEGIAVFEELKMNEPYRRALMNMAGEKFSAGTHIPLAQLAHAKATEEVAADSVNLWYAEAGLTVDFLYRQRTPQRFWNFCQRLKVSGDPDDALSYAYAGEFKTLADVDSPLKSFLLATPQ